MSEDRTQAMPPGATAAFPGPPPAGADPDRTQLGGPPPAGASSTGALTLSARVGNRLAESAERTRQYISTVVRAGGGRATGKRLPVNLALVIDRSGSMEGEPLEYVKRACAYVVDQLTPDDVLSIVTFEENVDILMPARRVTDPELIKQHIARIAPGNTTNLFDGLYAGAAQVASTPLAGYVSRVLLLTDGEPTAGLRDFGSIVNQAGDLKARGVAVTALGFGPEYNEELMAGIARRGGGNYYFIARPEEIPAVFQREMEQVLGVTARNVRMALQLPRGSAVRQVYGSPVTFAPRSAEISLGDLEGGASVTKLWEMDWEPRRAGTYRVAKAVLTYDDGETGRTLTQTANVVVDFITDESRIPTGIDLQVTKELAVLQAGRDLEKTMMGMRTQQLSVADVTQALHKTEAFLTQQGRADAAQHIAEATQAFAGGDADALNKTLIGAIWDIERGKRGR
jgi:Ca-activated chloride channel family protein